MSLLTSVASIINNVMGQTVSESKTEMDPSDTDMQSDSISHTDVTKHDENGLRREPLEWKFLDFTKAKRSPIFDVDPVMLKKFIGHNVTVMSISRQEFRGCCLAIDPVSLSVILAQRILDKIIRVITVPGYYLSKITVDSSSVPAENRVSVNDLDVAELYHAPSLYSDIHTSNDNGPPNISHGSSTQERQECQLTPSQIVSTNYTPDDIEKRKERLMELLQKHRMPVTVKGDCLEIPGVKIKSPYTVDSCDTTNLMIKKKLGELIKSI